MANILFLSRVSLILSILDSSYAQGDYAYLGCYWDDYVRALPHLTSCNSEPRCISPCSDMQSYCRSDSMTVDYCATLCRSNRHMYAGLQDGNQCFCGSVGAQYNQYGVSVGCGIACTGNSSLVCGGLFTNSVYDTLYRQLQCPVPGTVTNGMIQTGEKTTYVEGDNIRYICDENTFMLGQPIITCLSSGLWDIPLPECKNVCNVAIDVKNSVQIPEFELVIGSNVEGEQYLITCDTGYIGTNGATSVLATCQADHSWSYDIADFECQAVVCDFAVLGAGVSVIDTDFTYGSVRTYICDIGSYAVTENSTSVCQANGTWSGQNFICEPTTYPTTEIVSIFNVLTTRAKQNLATSSVATMKSQTTMATTRVTSPRKTAKMNTSTSTLMWPTQLPVLNITSEIVNNGKAKSTRNPADFMILIVVGAGALGVIFLTLIAFVGCAKSPKRANKPIYFIKSKETGSMIDILWPGAEHVIRTSPRSRADSGLPSTERNSPNEHSPGGAMVNLAFENDDVFQTTEDPYHRIDFFAANGNNNTEQSSSGVMSPPPQTQGDRISNGRLNSFQQPDDIEPLYTKVDMSKKRNRRIDQSDNNRCSIANPIYEATPMPPPAIILDASKANEDANQTKSRPNGAVRKASRRTPSDVSVNNPAYWTQYEEQVTRL